MDEALILIADGIKPSSKKHFETDTWKFKLQSYIEPMQKYSKAQFIKISNTTYIILLLNNGVLTIYTTLFGAWKPKKFSETNKQIFSTQNKMNNAKHIKSVASKYLEKQMKFPTL